MPICFFFNSSLDGSGCKLGDACPYLHVRVAPDADVCPDFVKFGGYCPRGTECKMKHTDECQAHLQFGECPLGDRCKLRHRESKKRKKMDESNPTPDTGPAPDGTSHSPIESAPKKRKLVPNFDQPQSLKDNAKAEQTEGQTHTGRAASTSVFVATADDSTSKRIKPSFL